MKRLYRGAETSPLLHPIDAQAWMKNGWSETPTVEDPQPIAVETPPPTKTPDEAPTLTREGRAADLDGMSWQAIRTLHEDNYKLGDYPGKDDAIAAILVAEGY